MFSFLFIYLFIYLFITADHVWQASNRTHHGVKRTFRIHQRLLIIPMMTHNESKIEYMYIHKRNVGDGYDNTMESLTHRDDGDDGRRKGVRITSIWDRAECFQTSASN
jgi:hypothetical protein